jgi:hypothetical protein
MGLVLAGCTSTFDAGVNNSYTRLPVDERNPIVIINDGVYDNWQGEYALLLSNGAGPKLVGIIVVTTTQRSNLEENLTGWRALVDAARKSGMKVVYPTGSTGAPLKRPANGEISATVPNRSEGANLILKAAEEYALPYRPLVVATGTRLTDVADAYLMDQSIVDRVVVVSSLGTLSPSGAGADMGIPNGEMDTWADAIVAAKFTYIQVSANYQSTTDVPASRLGNLPSHDFGLWVAAKQPGVWDDPKAADQVAVQAVGVRGFVVSVDSVAPSGQLGDGGTGPALVPITNGRDLLVREIASSKATEQFWTLINDSKTYKH